MAAMVRTPLSPHDIDPVLVRVLAEVPGLGLSVDYQHASVSAANFHGSCPWLLTASSVDSLSLLLGLENCR